VVTKKVYLALLSLVVLVLASLGWGLSARFATSATIHYPFEIASQDKHNLTLTIPLRDYRDYKERPRPTYGNNLTRNEIANQFLAKYSYIADDRGDDALINNLVVKLEEEAASHKLSELRKIELVLRFVQSLTYTTDNATTPSYDEYPRYPLETLFEQGGDCEDSSILMSAILMEMGYEVAFLLFEGFDHMGLGINFPVGYGNSWIYEATGIRYWYLDTSGKKSIGWAPEQYAETPAYLFPISG